jgi:drug/metabolite transporter (DMT)-like permease
LIRPLFRRNSRRMLQAHLQRQLGIALVVAAAIAWSTAPFFTRLLHLDSWTILFCRGLAGGGCITAFLVLTRGRSGVRDLIETGRSGWLVACLSTLGMVTFIPALQLTNVSNVAIIIATGPFAAAGIAWIWLREATRPSTLIAGLVALSGIAIIVGSPGDAADIRGIGLACIMTIAIAAMTVAVRRYRQSSMVAAAALSNFLGSLVSIPFAQGLTEVTGRDLAVLAMFGLFQVGMGLTLFVLGSRLLPSGQTSLIATLETPLMPFWVWLAFDELPTPRALIGGSLVMDAVVADIIADNWARAQADATSGR